MTATLIGNYLSPYARRVAISMNLLDVPFELQELLVFQDPETVSAHNPVTRIPTLIPDDGQAIFESSHILDYLDETVGPDRALIPTSGKARRDVLRLIAIAIGVTERAQWAFYETRFHPEDKVHQPWIEHNENRAIEGLRYLDGIAEQTGDGGWLAGGDRLTQADITAAVAFSFTAKVRPNIGAASLAPTLANFTDRCEAIDAFRAAPIPA